MPLHPSLVLLVPMTALLVSAASAVPAPAQAAEATKAPAAKSETVFGVGVWSRPAYVGSDARVLSVIPIIRYYGSPWFARTTQGMLEAGARVAVAGGVSIGAQVAYEVGRDSKDSDFLASRDVTTLPSSASIGVHAGWDTELGPVPLTVLLRYRREAVSERGAQADLRAAIGLHRGAHLRFGLFAQSTWANAESNQAYYGVSAADAGAPGLFAFDSDAGMVYVAAGLPWSYELGSKWMLQGNLEVRQLSAELYRSPLTQMRVNSYASAGLAYHF